MADKELTSRSDPLSPATRNTKRHLLLVGVVAITFKAFQISIEKIPVAGLVINFDRGVFEFLLALALAYLLVTFALYYYIDIRNFPATSHEESTNEWRTQRIDRFISDWYVSTAELVAKIAPPPFEAHLNADYQEKLRDIVYPMRKALQLDELRRRGIVPANAELNPVSRLLSVSGPTTSGHESIRKTTEKKAQTLLDERTKEFPHAFRKHLRRLTPRVLTVRVVYLTRNYVTDGMLPFAIGVTAILAIYNLIDVHFLTNLVPRDALRTG